MTIKRISYYLGIAGTVIFLVFLLYSVCIDIPFAHHDSLRYFGRYFLPQTGDTLSDPYYPFSWVQGRPVASEMENFIFHHVHDFSGLSLGRLFCALLAGLVAFLMMLSFRRIPLDSRISVLLGVWIAVLPGIQNSVYMLWPHYLLGVGSAICAYLVWISRFSIKFRLGALFIFLLFSLFCYTVTAFIFLALLVVPVLWAKPDEWKKLSNDVVIGTLLLIVCSVLYFSFAKGVLAQRFPDALANTYAVRQLNPSFHHFPLKIAALLTDGVPFVFNPFSPRGGILWGYTLLLLFLFALTMDRAWDWSLRWRRMLVWCILLFASVAVWIISPMDILLYRALYPGMVLCAISLVWAVEKISQYLGWTRTVTRTILIVLLGLGILGAQQTLTLNVWNANAEMTFIRSQLARAARSEVKRIHVIEPLPEGYGFNGRHIVDDYVNMNSSNYDFDLAYFVKMGLWAQIPNRPLWHCQYQQQVCVENTPLGVLLLTHSRTGEPIFASDKMIVVDLNDMVMASRIFRTGIKSKGAEISSKEILIQKN